MPALVRPTYRNVMDRRRFLLAGGLAVVGLSACGAAGGTETIFREAGVFFNARELSIVDVVSDIMIPETDTPGARDVDAAGFADGMMEGWALPDTQVRVRETLIWLNSEAQQGRRAAFLALGARDQKSVLERLDTFAFQEEASGFPEAVAEGYRRLKSVIYRGYYLSEPGATVELQYEHVPGGFRGCVPLEEIGRSWAI